MLWLNYVLMLLAGFFTKFTDNLVDERFLSPKFLKYFTALLYGAILGWLVSISGFSALVVGAILGNLFFGRFDNKAHQLALFSTILAGVVFGIPQLNLAVLLFLAFATWLDEWLNDNSKNILLRQRLALIIACAITSIYLNAPAYFLAIAFFDVGYFFSEIGMEKFLKKFDSSYGNHLILDFYKCNSKKLDDAEFAKNLLKKTVELLKMTPISDFVAFEYKPKNELESGVSGFVFIAESHVAIHTYPHKKLAKFDAFSCKKFSSEKIESFLQKEFEAEEVDKKFFNREKKYPYDLEKERKL